MKFVLLLLFEVVAIYAEPCPGGWTHHGTSCYSFVTSAKEHWVSASYFCSLHEATLVEVNSANESDFLRRQLSSLGVHADFWIGLTDDSLEGKWEWLPSGATPSYTEWAPGQPDNGHNEDCALMSRSKDYHWNDDQCDNNHHFICERESAGDQITIVG
ncbi:perlucin-like [Crassostrea virginica]